jgi:hypothetical protein
MAKAVRASTKAFRLNIKNVGRGKRQGNTSWYRNDNSVARKNDDIKSVYRYRRERLEEEEEEEAGSIVVC